MKKIFSPFSLAFLFIFASSCAPGTSSQPMAVIDVTPPANMEKLDGKLVNQITRLEDKLPRANTNGFVIPTDDEKNDFFALITELREKHLDGSITIAQKYGYELLWYTDQNDQKAVSYVLREVNPSQKGWGLYVLRVGTNSKVIVEAPHPLSDDGTPALAVDVFRALDARSLLVAGAHRDANPGRSADAAHASQTIFQSVHDAESQQAIATTGTVIILQIHGFGASKHPRYPHVIVSYERGSTINPIDIFHGSELETSLASAMETEGIKTGSCGTGEWSDLCGATNIQSSLMTKGLFIHIELDESIRKHSDAFIRALQKVLSTY